MAVINSGYPMNYQNPYLVQPQYQQPAQQSSGIIWVLGEAGAKSYMVAPNTSVALFDSESQTVYIKSADASGMPQMKILDYTIRDNSPSKPSVNNVTYATKDDFDLLSDQIDSLRADIDSMMKKGGTK